MARDKIKKKNENGKEEVKKRRNKTRWKEKNVENTRKEI